MHPNELARRGRATSAALVAATLLLVGAFFRVQVFRRAPYAEAAEANRLRAVPVAAPRGVVYDRHGRVLAENVPAFSASFLSPAPDSLRRELRRLAAVVPLSDAAIDAAVARLRRNPTRPVTVLPDVPFDVLSILEERRAEFPDLVVHAAPKRHYPDGPVVATVVGYTGEITDRELGAAGGAGPGRYAPGQQIGRAGLEQQYDAVLRGQDGARFVEVDARGRVTREAGARPDRPPQAGRALTTTIDLALQRAAAAAFGDSLRGGLVAMDPRTGEVLALYSAPTFDPNRFVGGVSAAYYDSLRTDPGLPLFNKVIQARYPPASTWKLATTVLALEQGVVRLDERMPVPDRGGYWYGGRYFRDWYRPGHGDIDLARAIEVSCNVYFYQLGLRLGLPRLLAGGVALGFRERTGIDLPGEAAPRFPTGVDYYDRRYGPRGWSNAVTLNLAIGQGENDQTLINMARFYTALATDGRAVRPTLVRRGGSPDVERQRLFTLTAAQMAGVRAALAGVVSERGTSGGARIPGLVLAGKTGTAQNASDPANDHAWFVGFAPADDPQLLVAVVLEFGQHGSAAARVASGVVARYFGRTPIQQITTGG